MAGMDEFVTDTNEKVRAANADRRTRRVWELWSWNERNQTWLAVEQGTEREMKKAADRKYAAATRQNVAGCAFLAADKVPTAEPSSMGVEVTVAAYKPVVGPNPSPLDGQRINAIADARAALATLAKCIDALEAAQMRHPDATP